MVWIILNLDHSKSIQNGCPVFKWYTKIALFRPFEIQTRPVFGSPLFSELIPKCVIKEYAFLRKIAT